VISPFTKPGTEVVCIHATPGKLHRFFIPLEAGAVYRVRAITESPYGEVFGAYLEGIQNMLHPDDGKELGYQIRRFRYLDLAGLDALLTEKSDLPLELEAAR